MKIIDLNKLQKEIYKNKVDKGFNITDINKEVCLTNGEVAEVYEAWRKKKDDLGEELADVAIYLLGLSEILGIDLEDEIQKKFIKILKENIKLLMVLIQEQKNLMKNQKDNLSDNLQFLEQIVS